MPNLEEIISKLPATDEDAKAGQPPQVRSSKFTGPPWVDASKLCDEVLSGGAPAIVELVGLLRDPASEQFKSYRAEYMVHVITTYVGAADKEAQRRVVIDAIASQLTSEALGPYVRAFLLRELQWVGDAKAAGAIAKCLGSAELCQPAVTALLAILDGAAEPLRTFLPSASGAGRLAVLHGLAYLADTASRAAFQKALTDGEENIRLTGAWGICQLANPEDIDALLKAAEVPPSYEQSKLSSLCLQMAENLIADGKKKEAARIYQFIRDKRTDAKDAYLRDAADRGLKAAAG